MGGWRLVVGMRLQGASPDAAVAAIASGQHGVVTFAQLRAAGLSQSALARRVAAGRLYRLHRGVYAVGHRGLANEGRWLAAVLACGEGAVLSHLAAAALWGLLAPRSGPIDVTVPTSAGRRRREGIRIHRSSVMPQGAIVRRRRIPVTDPARTISDLRGAVPARVRRQAIREAEFRGYATGLETDGTRSDTERLFLALCRRHGLPLPKVNVSIGPFTMDFVWVAHRLVVEVDGYAAHRGRQAFEDDRERELVLAELEFRLRRFSDHQVRHRAAAVAAAVRAELATSARGQARRGASGAL
jgi:very-short-patch-repair endonuclease